MKNKKIVCIVAIVVCVIVGGFAVAFGQTLHPLSLQDFCVTEGHITKSSSGLVITESKTRAVVGWKTAPEAELSFRYLGPTEDQSALKSGSVRTQIGLKMRAQNGCNLVYVMWRILPQSQLVVSVKSNPGQQTYAQCENRGYVNVKAEKSSGVSAVEPGSTHSLRAEFDGENLNVRADGKVVWEGDLDESAFRFDGPLGFRTDNGRFDVQFLTSPGSGRVSCTGHMGPE